MWLILNNNRVECFDHTGTFLRAMGASDSGEGLFYRPSDIATDGNGNVFVADSYNNRIQVFNNAGIFLRKWGIYGPGDGQFIFPSGIAVGSNGLVYVVDAGNNRIQVFSSLGNFMRSWGSYGTGDGQFNRPSNITLDKSGNVYVTDFGNNRVQVFSDTGTFLKKWNTNGCGERQWGYSQGIAVDSNGKIYVSDTCNSRIEVFNQSGVLINEWGTWGAENSQFEYPADIELDLNENLYVTDFGNNRIQVFDNSGSFLGKWGESFGHENGHFGYPQGIAVDRTGIVFVADTGYNRIQVFDGRVSDTDPPVTTAMPNGTLGNNGWYISDVVTSLTAKDSGSGVKEIHYAIDGGAEVITAGSTASVSITGDGIHSFIYYAIDNARNKETARTLTIKIDKTPPTITASSTPAANAFGWNNTDVTVTSTCNDATSGVYSCTGLVTVTKEGANQIITGTAVDIAGNTATASVVLNIDKTPPSISSLAASPSILWPPNHKMVDVAIGGGASDSLSGIASTLITVTDEYGVYNNMTVPGFGSTIQLEAWREGTDKDGRVYTITAVVTDKAGNQTTATTTALVPHDIR